MPGVKRLHQELYERGDRSRLNPKHTDRIELILADLDAAKTLKHLNRPGYRLHELKGDLRGFYAIDVSGNWRITFRFEDGDIFDVIYVE